MTRPKGNKPQAKRVAEELLEHDEAALARIRDGLSRVYNAVGPDLGWTTKTPGKGEFADVLCEFVEVHAGLSREDRNVWSNMSAAARRALCLSVGP